MSDLSEIRSTVLRCMAEFAPNADLSALTDATPLSEIGIDSLALFHFIVKVEGALGLSVPDAELSAANFRTLAGVLTTLDRLVQGTPERSAR